MADAPPLNPGRRTALATLTGTAWAAAIVPDPATGAALTGFPVHSLLDFVPYGQIAPMREGRSTWDASETINRGLRDLGPGAILSPSGVTYAIGQPIDLQRGTSLRHLGSFDDMPGKGAIIKLLPGANCAAIRTPAARGEAATHFTCFEGFCIDGAKADQTRPAPLGAVQWWGEFIGSEIRRIMVKDTLGPGLTLGNGADVLLDHVWIVGACLPDGGYALDTNVGATGDVRGGLLTMSHIFVENPSIRPNGEPRHRQDDRGHAVRFHRLVSTHVGRMHIEGARRGLSIESCDQIDIGLLSGIWLGHSADPDRCFVNLVDANTRALRINSITCLDGGLPLVRKRQGVHSDTLPDLAAGGHGMNLGYAATNESANGMPAAPATCFSNELMIGAVGHTDRAAVRLEVDGTTGHLALSGDRLEIGVSLASDNLRVPSIALTAPLLVGDAGHATPPAGSLARTGSAVMIGRVGNADQLATLRVVEQRPHAVPDAVGILLFSRADRRLWLSVGTASMSDWVSLT